MVPFLMSSSPYMLTFFLHDDAGVTHATSDKGCYVNFRAPIKGCYHGSVLDLGEVRQRNLWEVFLRVVGFFRHSADHFLDRLFQKVALF